MLEFESLVADFSVSDCVPTSRLPLGCGNFIESVVAELIHEAVLHCWRGFRINAIHTIVIVVVLLNLGEDASYTESYRDLKNLTSDPDHPKELGDVIAAVVGDTTEDDKNVVCIKVSGQLVGLVLF